MRILAAQIQIPSISTTEEQQSYLESLLTTLKEQVQDNAVDMVLLPELATMDYSTENFRNIQLFRDELKGEVFQLFSAFCQQHQVALCFGMPRAEGDETYISQIVIDKQGDYLTHYDKIHLAEYGDSSESRFFKKGQHLAVFEIEGVKAGILICYDMRFPELSRRYCMEFDVDVLLHPVAFAQDCSFPSWKQFVVSRALENQVYFVSLNRAGPHFGFSAICPPWIDDQVLPTILPEEQTFYIFEIDKKVIAKARQDIPFRSDARSNYSELAVRNAV